VVYQRDSSNLRGRRGNAGRGEIKGGVGTFLIMRTMEGKVPGSGSPSMLWQARIQTEKALVGMRKRDHATPSDIKRAVMGKKKEGPNKSANTDEWRGTSRGRIKTN